MQITVPKYSRDDNRGQVGIETLIVFIAMILVAAIAASVLINTAGFLQNQASQTSQDSEDQVSNQVLIISSIGEVVEVDLDATEDDVTVTLEALDNDEYELSVTSSTVPDGTELDVEDEGDDFSSAPDSIEVGETVNIGGLTNGDGSVEVSDNDGSDDSVELSSSAADAGDAEETLSVAYVPTDNQIGEVSMTVMQSPGAGEIDLSGASIEYIGPDGQQLLSYESGFEVEGTQDPEGTAPVLTERQDRYSISIALNADTDSELRYLEAGEDATVRITTQSGSEAVTIVNVPQSISSFDDGDAVEL